MKVFRKIDTTTGNFLEDVGFDNHPFLMETVTEIITHEDETTEEVTREQPLLDAEGNPQLDPQYVAEPIPSGVYALSGVSPQWNGKEWVEGGVAPEPTPPTPTDSERIVAMEEALDFLLMGGM